MILKFIYTLFIGILLALFVGFGIAAFYEEPKYPTYPVQLQYARPIYTPEKESSEAGNIREVQKSNKQQINYENRQKDFEKKIATYNRNVSALVLIAAIIFLAVGLILEKKLFIISDGLLLGGVFTLLYGIFRGFSTNDNKFQFVVVTIGLVISVALGYIKFIKPASESTGKNIHKSER